MSDVQILAAGSESIPYAYTVPNTQEVIPKAVSAIFDGTGAAAAFLPVLEIVSDAGIVVAQSPATQVAAGGSAEVSWFPRVGAGGGGASGLRFAYIGYSGSPVSCTGNAVTNLPATSATFYTNASSTFSAGTHLGIPGIVFDSVGHYLVSTTAGPTTPFSGHAVLYEVQIANGGFQSAFEAGTSVVATPPGGLTDQGRVEDTVLMTATSAPTVSMITQIVNASANAVSLAFFGMYAIQIDTDTTMLT